MFDFEFLNLAKTTFCVIRSDGTEGPIEACVVSPRYIMVHHCIRSK